MSDGRIRARSTVDLDLVPTGRRPLITVKCYRPHEAACATVTSVTREELSQVIEELVTARQEFDKAFKGDCT